MAMKIRAVAITRTRIRLACCWAKATAPSKRQPTTLRLSIPVDIAVGDFNGDGMLDLVTANDGMSTEHTASVLLGNGDGIFQDAVNYTTDLYSSAVAVGDLNSDGKLDLAVANYGGS